MIHELTLAIRETRNIIIPSLLWRIGNGLLPGILGAEKPAPRPDMAPIR